MNDKRKSNSVVTHRLDGTRIIFSVKGAGDIALDMSRLHAEVMARAAIHGLIQRISDRAAMDRDSETGLPATPEAKMARMQALADHYMSGSAEWSTRATGNSGGNESLTIEALAAWKGKEASAIREWVEAKAAKEGLETKALLATLAKIPEVILAAATIRAKRAGAVDVSLEGL